MPKRRRKFKDQTELQSGDAFSYTWKREHHPLPRVKSGKNEGKMLVSLPKMKELPMRLAEYGKPGNLDIIPAAERRKLERGVGGYQLRAIFRFKNKRTGRIFSFNRLTGKSSKESEWVPGFSRKVSVINNRDLNELFLQAEKDALNTVWTNSGSGSTKWIVIEDRVLGFIYWSRVKNPIKSGAYNVKYQPPKRKFREVKGLKPVKKYASEKELERKYPTPKKYAAAQKKLSKKIKEQNKRQKARTGKRK